MAPRSRESPFAVPPGADARMLARRLHDAHEAFLSTGSVVDPVRSVVGESWRRSLDGGLDPERDLAHIALDEAALEEIRRSHPLAAGMPVVRRLLVETAAESGMLVAVSDAAGRLLWVEGSSQLRSRAEQMNFVEGADWSESSAGTNAPGTALALGRAVSLLGPEHLARSVTPWSCSAAPVHDPDTGAVLGVIDLTGGVEVASAPSLGLVRATAAAVEAELRLARVRDAAVSRTTWTPGVQEPRLEVLGVRGALLHHATTTARLSARHSEIAVLVALADRGMTTAELAVALSDDDLPEVTVRAELSRLRQVLGGLRLESRPYRFVEPIRTDIDDLRADLEAGRLRQAVARYRGPLLPDSQAPAIAEARDDLHQRVRSHLVAGDDPDAMLGFADTAHGRDDYELWDRIARVLPRTSPRYTQVVEHLERLDADLA